MEIKCESYKILIAVIYRRPKAGYPIEIFQSLSDIFSDYTDFIITGDFNFPMHTQHPDSDFFLNLLHEYSLTLVPSDPTHHTFPKDSPHTHTWLDLFIVRSLKLVRSYSKSVIPFAAGHDLISLEYNLPSLHSAPRIIFSRNLAHLDFKLLCENLESALKLSIPAEPTIPTITNPDYVHIVRPTVSDLALLITTETLSCYDTQAPRRKFTIHTKNKPWISDSIRTKIKLKHKAYHRSKTTGRPRDTHTFLVLRSQISNEINSAKNKYHASLLTSSKDSKTLWRHLKNMGISTPPPPSPLKYFTSNTLNTHYAEVSRASPPLHLNALSQIISRPLQCSLPSLFEFSPITALDIDRVLFNSTKNCTGPDFLSTNMLKLVYPTLRPHLVQLFNNSFDQCTFPDSWKLATILPLSKIHPPKSPSETRPIALLPELSKLFERVVHSQLLKYLISNRLLDERQSGFKPHHSTQTALLAFTEDVRSGIENRLVTVTVLFDFSKAFDSISHELLLHKLRSINCSTRVIKWFASYLSGRSQVIRNEDDSLSDVVDTFTGVPQGSVLGPLLFAIFINDLSSVLKHCQHGIFADDTRIYLQCRPSQLVHDMHYLISDALRVSGWSCDNLIKLNPIKTKLILLGSHKYVSDIDLSSLPKLFIDNTHIDFSVSAVDLGCQITSTLDWTKHVNMISSRVHKALYSLRFHRQALSRTLRCNLVETLIIPHFDYACAVYHDLTKEQNLKLHRLLNRCVRFVHGFIPWKSPLTPYRLSLGWLSVEDRRLLLLSCLAFSILSYKTPNYLFDCFTLRESVPDRRVTPRNVPAPLIYSTPRTVTLEHSFHITASKFINSLAEYHITFDHTLLPRFKSIALNTLIYEEIQQWRKRVSLDVNLVLNPIPTNTTLTELLNL